MDLKLGASLIASLLLSACAASVISGNRSVVVIGKLGVLSVEEAQPLAEAHCAAYGKRAELDHAGTRDMYFRCRDVATEIREGESRQEPATPPAEQQSKP